MTKLEMVKEIISGLKTDERDIRKMVSLPKELLNKWYNEYLRVKEHPEVLKDGKVKTWQITARWMLLRK